VTRPDDVFWVMTATTAPETCHHAGNAAPWPLFATRFRLSAPFTLVRSPTGEGFPGYVEGVVLALLWQILDGSKIFGIPSIRIA